MTEDVDKALLDKCPSLILLGQFSTINRMNRAPCLAETGGKELLNRRFFSPRIVLPTMPMALLSNNELYRLLTVWISIEDCRAVLDPVGSGCRLCPLQRAGHPPYDTD